MFKIFFLASLVLSMVMGLGAMLQPLRQFSINPGRVPELILYTLPITMTMVLPIAALLAATLVYGRLAVDNEITACRSSGIGLLTLIYPALALSLIVGTITLLLVFHVIPDFIARSERIIKEDAKAIIFREIEKRGNLGEMFKGVKIHADYADPENDRLVGVVVLLREKQKIEWMINASQVYITVEEGKPSGQIKLSLYDCIMVDDKNQTTTIPTWSFAYPLPQLLADDIKFKKLKELKEIEEDMTRFEPVYQLHEQVRHQYITERFFQWCQNQIDTQQYIDLNDNYKRRLLVYADSCSIRDNPDKQFQKKGWQGRSSRSARTAVLKAQDSSSEWPLKVDLYRQVDDMYPEKIFQSPGAVLVVNTDLGRAKAQINFNKVRWHYLDDSLEYALTDYGLPEINIPEEIVREAETMSFLPEDGLDMNALLAGRSSSYLIRLYDELKDECLSLTAQIQAEKNSRFAFGVSCVVLVLMGAALGIVFRSGHLLTAFGVSSVPAAFCLITIFTGKHISEGNPENIGLGIMFLWGGIMVVGLADIFVYHRLLKN
ncbi:MAG: LptF/LptG family permease [Sedimentisphaerales bacterium]|nr:LptF/LptG family permease [Sedimentisphaerales bacterium]